MIAFHRTACNCVLCAILDNTSSAHSIFFSLFVFDSAKRWLGNDRWAIRGSGLAGSLGRRSQPLSLSPSPHLLIIPPFPPALSPSILYIIIPIAGVRGTITRYVTTIPSPSTTYHFYELDVSTLDQDWLESKERRREWVDYAEAIRRISWKPQLARGLTLSTLAPRQ